MDTHDPEEGAAGRGLLLFSRSDLAGLAALALIALLVAIQVRGPAPEADYRPAIIIATPTLAPLPTLIPTALPSYQPPPEVYRPLPDYRPASTDDHSVNICVGWCSGANTR